MVAVLSIAVVASAVALDWTKFAQDLDLCDFFRFFLLSSKSLKLNFQDLQFFSLVKTGY